MPRKIGSSPGSKGLSENEQRAFLMIEHLIDVQSNGQNVITVEQAQSVLDSFFALFDERHPQYL